MFSAASEGKGCVSVCSGAVLWSCVSAEGGEESNGGIDVDVLNIVCAVYTCQGLCYFLRTEPIIFAKIIQGLKFLSFSQNSLLSISVLIKTTKPVCVCVSVSWHKHDHTENFLIFSEARFYSLCTCVCARVCLCLYLHVLCPSICPFSQKTRWLSWVSIFMSDMMRGLSLDWPSGWSRPCTAEQQAEASFSTSGPPLPFVFCHCPSVLQSFHPTVKWINRERRN